jgi:hypothetical protein
MKILRVLGISICILFITPFVRAVTLDSRISINHQGPYPQFGARALPEGAKKAIQLGFQTIELYVGMGMCRQIPTNPDGLYGTYDFCNKDDQGRPTSTTKSIVEYAQHPMVIETLDLPFKTIIIDTDASLATSANVQHGRILPHPLPQGRLQGTYNEFYALSKFLLARYNGQDKTFIISTPNELDWQMLPEPNPDLNPSDSTILNARDYLNTISRAIKDAKRDTPTTNIKLYHACEANLLQKAKNGGKTAVNDVFPYTQCDLYGYSAYDSVALDNEPNAITDILAYYKNKAPDSPNFGNNNVYISEVSGATNYSPPEPESIHVKRMNKVTNQSLTAGVPYIGFWQLYNYCPTYPSQCIANWIVKPNGELSEVYNQVFLPMQVTSLPSIIQKPGDANGDNKINGQDYII